MGEEVYWVLEVSERVLVLKQVLEEASTKQGAEGPWRAVGYFEGVQLTQLFSTKNNLLIHALSRELLVLSLSYSHSPF